MADYWLETIDAANGYYYQPATISNVDYDALNHPTRIATSAQSLTWLWDGNDRFLQCHIVNGQCVGVTFSLEGLADYDPSTGTSAVYDRNRSGIVVSSHTNSAFSSWADIAGGPRVFPTLPQGPCSTNDATDPSTYCAKLRTGKLTADGWTIDNATWQGVRSSDLSVGQWNTPDAYAGEVHDPMTQKPFMWNRNNPYAYSDPSGYCVGPLVIACAWALANAPEILAVGAVAVEAAGGSGGGGRGVWARGWASRGVVIESALAKNTSSAFPVIDRFVAGQGTGAASVTSIKSMDLAGKTYQARPGPLWWTPG